jgi:hypothetical protein
MDNALLMDKLDNAQHLVREHQHGLDGEAAAELGRSIFRERPRRVMTISFGERPMSDQIRRGMPTPDCRLA